jgi:hypothetical protein
VFSISYRIFKSDPYTELIGPDKVIDGGWYTTRVISLYVVPPSQLAVNVYVVVIVGLTLINLFKFVP